MALRLKKTMRRFANLLGIDIIRLHKSPAKTLLGLSRMNFGAIIDVGANEGQFARWISRFFPKAVLYCFEPLEEPFTKLAAWASTQNGRVTCLNVALGDAERDVDMHLHQEHTPSSSLLAATEHCHWLYPQTRTERINKVRLTTLDQALAEQLDHMPHNILLKLDVQGYEDRVLRGGKRTLAECQACILEVCLDPLYEGQADFYTLAGIFDRAGFRYAGNLNQVYDDDGRIIYIDAVFVKL